MFGYDDAVARRFPAIRAGVIHATGLVNGPSPPDLLGEYQAGQQAARERLAATAIADIPSIAAWRRVFTQFGAKPTHWCWRQSAQSATSEVTTEALIVVEGHHDTAAQDTASAVSDLTRLLAAHQPAAVARSYLLSPACPAAP